MKKVFLLAIILISTSFAQKEFEQELTGILNIDNQIVLNNSQIYFELPDEEISGKKSPFLAGVMSFAVPGAGEVYNGDYLKAALFVAAEVTLIYLNSEYNKKGDDKTTEFESYAESNWSVKKYAEWSMHRFGLYDEWSSRVLDSSQPNGVNWNELNAMEDVISSTTEGRFYSHHLAPYQAQQYYEMIGKYPQFVAGWNDFSDPNFNYQYGDGTTANFDFYSGMRGDANDFYNKASTMTTIIIVNHIVSGIDAIISANKYNKSLEVKAQMGHRNLGLRNVYYPELNFRLSL